MSAEPVRDFLMRHPPHGGMPDSRIRIGVEFEVGGCYETWGWIVERLEYVSESCPSCWQRRTLGTGGTLEHAIAKATETILKELEASKVEKCWCGKATAIHQTINGENVPFCSEHNAFYGNGQRGPSEATA